MKAFLMNRWSRIGLGLAVLGWGPLLAVVLLSSLGLWPDPEPNPIGLGLLFFVTFWPAVIFMGVGYFQSRRGR
ncbi:MAG: hypothetical protein IT349_13865 [Candidatus Eisenbacteria bacterium]|nr:hypothetical protein [Candidatus Eisenbacteria bacterium]